MSRDEWCSSRHELCSVVLTWIELCTVALCCVELSCFVLSCVSLCFSKLCRMLSVAVVVLQWSSFMPVAHDSAFRVCVWHISENCKNCVWASVPKHLNDCKRLKAHREVYFKIDLNKFVSLMTRFPWFPSKATDVARFNGWRSGFACFFSLLLILETWIEGRGYCLLQRRLMPRHSHSSSSDPRPRRGDRRSKSLAPRTPTVMTWAAFCRPSPPPAPWPSWHLAADFNLRCQATLLTSPSKLSPWRLCPVGLSRRRNGWCKLVADDESGGATDNCGMI